VPARRLIGVGEVVARGEGVGVVGPQDAQGLGQVPLVQGNGLLKPARGPEAKRRKSLQIFEILTARRFNCPEYETKSVVSFVAAMGLSFALLQLQRKIIKRKFSK